MLRYSMLRYAVSLQCCKVHNKKIRHLNFFRVHLFFGTQRPFFAAFLAAQQMATSSVPADVGCVSFSAVFDSSMCLGIFMEVHNKHEGFLKLHIKNGLTMLDSLQQISSSFGRYFWF